MNQQVAYLNQLKQTMELYQFMVKLCWLKTLLDAQNPPENLSPEAKAKEKGASGAKKSVPEVHRKKTTCKSLLHLEKTEVSTIVASEVIKGRMYDFNNGRFLSVDPFIQGTTSQAINPYSYIQNNPLSGTDPTGYMIDDGGCGITDNRCGKSVNPVGSGAYWKEYANVDNGADRFTMQAAGANKIGNSLTLADLESQASNATTGVVTLLPIELDETEKPKVQNDENRSPHSTLKVSPHFALSQMSVDDQDKFLFDYITNVNDIAENIDNSIENTGFIEYIRGHAGYNIDPSERYIYLRELGLVDLQHVVSAAHNFLSRFTIGHVPGVGVEAIQVLKRQESGWLHEDFLSNRLGAISRYRPEGTTIGSRVQQIIINNDPVLSRDDAILLYYNNRDAER